MIETTTDRNRIITDLLNGMQTALRQIVPMNYNLGAPQLSGEALTLHYGILIGFTGDIKGRLIIAGEKAVFGSIGEKMFGMQLEEEMLVSFSGELGNMLAGGIATQIVEKGFAIDITVPTVMQGNTTLSGYEKAIKITAAFEEAGELDLYLLLN